MYSILDGHHRARAAQLSRREIPAYVISGSQYEALVKAEFGGEYPEQIMDLDQYIVLPDGQSYSDVRDVD
jgi:ParB-like chromosome segregation protein Spo0J